MHGLALRLREARHQLGVTQADLAKNTGIPYRTIQDGERGHSIPGGTVLAAYAKLGVDLNWLLLGACSETSSKPSPGDQKMQQSDPIKGKQFRISGKKQIRIPHFDPILPDYNSETEPVSVISLNPSNLMAFNLDYALLNKHWATLATTTIIDNSLDHGLEKGTLVLFDTEIKTLLPERKYVCRSERHLSVYSSNQVSNGETVLGQIMFVFREP